MKRRLSRARKTRFTGKQEVTELPPVQIEFALVRLILNANFRGITASIRMVGWGI
jgi:hypothetical protein